MKCKYCGKENENQSKFCGYCGKALEVPETYDGQNALVKNIPKKRRGKKASILIAIIGAVVLCVALSMNLLGTGTSSSKSGRFEFARNRVMPFHAGGSTVILGPGDTLHKVEGIVYSRSLRPGVDTTIDQSKAAFLELGDSPGNQGTLWFLNNKEKIKIDDEVYSFLLSNNGSSIMYITDFDGGIGTLWIYDINKDESTLVSRDAYYNFAISPDGKTFIYTVKSVNSRGEKNETYICRNGKKPERLENIGSIVAVSNNGEYIYHIDFSNDSFWVRNNESEVNLTPNKGQVDTSLSRILFNRDYSEVLYSYNEKTYISRDGENREKLFDSWFEFSLIPNDVGYYGDYYVMTLGVKSFKNTLLYTEEGIKYIDKDYRAVDLVEEYYLDEASLYISQDGKTVMYIDENDDLYGIENIDIEDNKPKSILKGYDIYKYVVSKDKSKIYFINYDDELWYFDRKDRPKLLAEDVDSKYLCLSPDGNTVFFVLYDEESTLCSSTNGGKIQNVDGAIDIDFVFSTPIDVVYSIDEDDGYFNVYISDKGIKFKKLTIKLD